MPPRPPTPSARFFAAFHKYISPISRLPSPIPTASPRRPRRPHGQPHRYQTTSALPLKESPTTTTFYDLFPLTTPSGPPPHGPFSIDPRQLRKEFLQLQARAHPDRHQGIDKARAEGASARINGAYKTLQNPLLRAQYLLSLRGIDVAEDESAKVEDTGLLMEVLEMRERIEAAEEAEEVEEMRGENERRIGESVGVLAEAFGRDDVGRAREEAVRLRYWVNVKESLDAWEKGKPVVLVH